MQKKNGSGGAIISDLKRERPLHEYDQSHLLNWLAHYHGTQSHLAKGLEQDEKIRKLRSFFERFGCSPVRIATRGSDLPEFRSTVFEKPELYSLESERDATTLERTRAYERIALRHMQALFVDEEAAPNHLMHVTCTGYVSPSAAQTLVDDKGWNERTAVTHLYHMGCYAALPAIRLAKAMCESDADQSITIAHTELCTLHLQKADLSPEQAVVQSLFGDGSIKYNLSSAPDRSGLEVLGTMEYILPKTRTLMTWKTGDTGMVMTLARSVPEAIRDFLERFLARFSKSHGTMDLENSVLAIHPGGPRIIDLIRDQLHLREDQIQHSQSVLRDYGNMSSSTLPHVWARILEDATVPSGQLILSLAFGPGLTMFAALMRKRT